MSNLPETAFAKTEHTAAAAIIAIFSHFAVNVLQQNANGTNNCNDQSSKSNRTKMIPK
jgi:hypothetical protein